ncbi:AT-hook motif nuclear-localized protein 19-like [Diospyros lotus]|uniref:AT-hook motif nuclear-localized protein 19-like n=1 Tax=Diospyros lotus TaxID=55363 RepID=UPI00225290EE|nr:AT-hook motif nuclear-localized protein 19-like [Diospyros lotus]
MDEYSGQLPLPEPVEFAHTSEEEEELQRSPATEPPRPSRATAPRKPRGRPPGSKNKPKQPVVLTQENDSGMKSVVLEIAEGMDVIDTVVQFARRHQLGVAILGARGSVSNVVVRLPAAVMTIQGTHEIISLTGTFMASLPVSSSASSPSLSPFAFGIALAGPNGTIYGGVLCGQVKAASTVVLLLGTFQMPLFYKFEEARVGRRGGGGAGDEGFVITQAAPVTAVSWAPTVRPF